MSRSRIVGYVRLSSSDDASTSIARQTDDLHAYADRTSADVVKVLEDDGVSGTKARANANEALRMIRDGEADTLVVWKFDRWSRQGIGALGDLVNALDETPGSRFVALNDGLDSTQAAWKIIAAVLSEVAAMEAKNTSLRVRSSIAALQRAGRFPGGAVPYGYRTAPAMIGPGRVLEVDPTEAEVVREGVAFLLAGGSTTALARRLNEQRVPTAQSPYRRAVARGETDVDDLPRGQWWAQSVRFLFSSDTLVGRVIRDGRPIVDEETGLPRRFWPAVIDAPTLARLRAAIGDARRWKTPDPARPRRTRRARLLSGLVFCAYCDRKMHVRTSSGRAVYVCQARSYGHICPAPAIAAQTLDDYVSDLILSNMGDLPEVVEVREEADATTAATLAEIEHALAEAGASLTLDATDVPATLARMASLKSQRAALRALPVTERVSYAPTGRTYAQAWQADDSTAARRHLIEERLDHLTVAKPETASSLFQTDRLTFHWREPLEDHNAA